MIPLLKHMETQSFLARPWLNWIERLATDQEVRGSNPFGRAILFNHNHLSSPPPRKQSCPFSK